MENRSKILYVDDEEINLKLFEISLGKKFDVITAISAIEGLEILENNPGIDVIVSDLKMPDMSGLEFITRIKEEDSKKVCIILSGFVESEALLEGFNREYVFRYLLKPWNKEQLIGTISEAIEIVSG